MKRPRTVLVALLFVGLAALEIDDGLDRLADARHRVRRERLEDVELGLEPLVSEIAEQIGDGRRHALHLARHPDVRALLDGNAAPGAADRLASVLQPYLASFTEIDRLMILDAEARERFRCERMGGAVATLPAALLDAEPAADLVRLAARAAESEWAVSPLAYDAERVEVEEADRRVFHLAVAVRTLAGPTGVVVVTVYASPLLQALEAFMPLPGTRTCLLDAEGRPFAPAPAAGDVDGLFAAGAVRERVLSGERRIEDEGTVHFVRATGVEPASFLVSTVPRDALNAVVPVGARLRTALRTLFVLSAMGLGTAFLARAGQRAARLLEAESYARRIREESEKLRALMDAAADIILIVRPESEVVEDWNPRTGQLFGLREGRGTASLAPIADAFEGDGGERLRAAVADASRVSEPVVVPSLALTRDGSRMDFDARCVGIDYGGRRLVELSFSDRTREREMERRARTAERLSALGLLTAGVAHEINNPLEGIANYLTLLERADDPETRKSHAAQVRHGFQRIRDITSELLPLARRPVRESGPAELAGVVERTVAMARLTRELRGVELEVAPVDGSLVVRGSEGGLEQVLLNLLLNAGRANGGTGTVRISVHRRELGEVELRVEDDGPGIREQDLERVFDPFFTTSGGTGLGLSVSYQIARAHGGELTASNRSEGGASFSLRLPLASGSEDADA